MDNEKQIEWLKPDRIMKLYGGAKNNFGTKKLLVIGVGKNGVDCLMRAKHIAENRYGTDKTKLRFLAVAEDKLIESAEFCGSVLGEDERIAIVPDDSIYKYLNDPESMPETVREWFDEGLRNYTPAKPVYGLQKRQCGRAALFCYFGEVMRSFAAARAYFSKNSKPLEIVIVGNMGDAFFGGMAIDLGYILKALFDDEKYPVKIVSYMFAGDTAKLVEQDGRSLGNYYANTIVTKGELDKFQRQKSAFSQKYSEDFEINSDKPPFSACYILPAEENYERTLEGAALKILFEPEILYTRDDDAEKLMSYNMLGNKGSHVFRYLSCGTAENEIPLGGILSFLSIKLLGALCGEMRKNGVGEMELGKISAAVTPNAMLLASKAGDIPKIEYNENLNPLFSIKSLKHGGEASKRYVNEKLEELAELCRQGAEILLPEISGEIIKACEESKNDIGKGPFYAAEIVKKALSQLKSAAKSLDNELANIEDDVSREEKLVGAVYRRLKATPSFMAAKTVEQYVGRLEEYSERKRAKLTGAIVKSFYKSIYKKLESYYNENLQPKIQLFQAISEQRDSILNSESPFEGFGVRRAFELSDPKILEKLNELADGLPEATRALAFKRTDLLNVPDGDAVKFSTELTNMAGLCFGEFLEQSYDGFCKFFGLESSAVSAAADCLERAKAKAPADDELTLTRVVCPGGASSKEFAALRAEHGGLNCIWSDSSGRVTVSASAVKGGVRLDGFEDYNKWENMRYAYVNDSLKKHGIHIFR